MRDLSVLEEDIIKILALPDFNKRVALGATLAGYGELFGLSKENLALHTLTGRHSLPVPKSIPEKTACWVCGHFFNREHSTPGPVDTAKIMVVSKAPGAGADALIQNTEEIESASALLYHQLKKAGLTDSDFEKTYVTAACRFYPPKKNIAAAWLKECKWLLWLEIFLTKPEYMLVLGSEAVKTLFGTNATVDGYRGDFTELTIDYGTEEQPDPHTIKVFVMTNPASMFRDPAATPEIELDMRVFVNRINGKTQTSSEPVEYHLVETVDQLNALEQLIKDKTVFAIDCEWHGQSPYHDDSYLLTIQLGWDVGKAATIVVNAQDDGGPANSCDNSAVRDMLNRVLGKTDEHGCISTRVVGHNFRADFPWLRAFGVDLTFQYLEGFDTMLAHHLLRETGGQGLEVCILEYTDLGRYDNELTQWVNENFSKDEEVDYGKIPRDMLYKYAMLDVDGTFRIYLGLEKDLRQNGRLHDLFKTVVMPASVAIIEMEHNGIYIDKQRLEDLSELYGKKRQQLKEQLLKDINWPDFNYRSVNQCRELLFGVELNGKLDKADPTKNIRLSPPGAKILNLSPIKTTEKPTKMWDSLTPQERLNSSPSTDAETLGMLASADSACELLRNLKFVDQVCKNFIPPAEDRIKKLKGLPKFLTSDSRIRTKIRQTLETGRWASRGPNLQNLPKRQEEAMRKIFKDVYKDNDLPPLRSMFIATPGWVLVEADYVQAELFGMAYLAKDANMINVLRDNRRDIHSEMAVKMFNLPYRGFDSDGPVKDWLGKQQGGKAMRVAAKTLAFGIPYGRGPAAIAREIEKTGLECNKQKAQGYIDTFFEEYPFVCEFLAEARRRVRTPGFLINEWGRYRRFYNTTDRTVMAAQEREAGNFLIQSLVADTLSKAAFNLWMERDMRRLQGQYVPDYKLLLGIHDALLIECKPEDVEVITTDIIPRCMGEMCRIPSLDLVFDVDISVHTRWGVELTEDEEAQLFKS